jgi:hypothetical protein
LACRSLAKKLCQAARKMEGKPLGDADLDALELADGRMFVRSEP